MDRQRADRGEAGRSRFPSADLLLDVARQAADAAHAPALRWFRRPGLTADDKSAGGRFDPVTAADREAETAMRAVLSRLRPDDGVIGEEHPETRGDSGVVWALDPIDGTRAFLAGAPTWGVLVAASWGGAPRVGVIDQPFTGERFEGVSTSERRAAWWRRTGEGRRISTRPCARLADAVLLSTFPEIGSAEERAGFEAVRDAARLTRYGLDCYGYALVAMGCADLVIEAGLAPWDVQALIPVIEGAGGRVSDWRGEPCPGGGRVIAAGDPRVHDAALEILAGV